MNASIFRILLAGACAALSASAENLVPEGKRDLQVPFQGAGKMGMVYTPCFFPKDTEAVLFTCEVRTEGVEAGAQKWFDARILTDSVVRPPHRVAACRRVTTPG